MPWVIAPSSASGCAGTADVASCCSAASCCRARFPTCGPLPWTTTTRQPASSTSFTAVAMAAALAIISSQLPDWPARVKALPPSATTAILVIGSCGVRFVSRIDDESFIIVNTTA